MSPKKPKKQPDPKTQPNPLPPWVPTEAWDAWEDMRRRLRKPLTDYARDLAVKRLDDLRGEGWDPERIINLAIESGWLKFWPPHDEQPDNQDDDPLPYQHPKRRYPVPPEELAKIPADADPAIRARVIAWLEGDRDEDCPQEGFDWGVVMPWNAEIRANLIAYASEGKHASPPRRAD